MNITSHAIVRCRQRGIPEDLIEIILNLGHTKRLPHGAIGRSINKRDCDRMIHELKRLIHRIEKLKMSGVYIVTSDDTGTIITVCRKNS